MTQKIVAAKILLSGTRLKKFISNCYSFVSRLVLQQKTISEIYISVHI